MYCREISHEGRMGVHFKYSFGNNCLLWGLFVFLAICLLIAPQMWTARTLALTVPGPREGCGLSMVESSSPTPLLQAVSPSLTYLLSSTLPLHP